ncbi:hypothetical protein CARUB_v10021947mg [Capsella rubella]|uniref:Uncharacterized protein n=1 Tax=Capsella rubella TaxID=81985 RepID=R0GFH7_9BRAS|nr:UPF0540 protein At1g62000 [Capsella rubella]EOA34416.1 hypothetical protein CARUB_v10021947mg [Capsella rubella]
MNTIKFAVLLVIGALCVNVSARAVSKESKLGTSTPKTATKGIGAELSAQAGTTSYSVSSGYVSVTRSRKGPNAFADGSGSTGTSGNVSADRPKSEVSSSSGSNAQGGAAGAADRRGAAAGGNGSAASGSTAKGRTSGKGKKN